jgi:hypothetical protein
MNDDRIYDDEVITAFPVDDDGRGHTVSEVDGVIE